MLLLTLFSPIKNKVKSNNEDQVIKYTRLLGGGVIFWNIFGGHSYKYVYALKERDKEWCDRCNKIKRGKGKMRCWMSVKVVEILLLFLFLSYTPMFSHLTHLHNLF